MTLYRPPVIPDSGKRSGAQTSPLDEAPAINMHETSPFVLAVSRESLTCRAASPARTIAAELLRSNISWRQQESRLLLPVAVPSETKQRTNCEPRMDHCNRPQSFVICPARELPL